MPRKKLADADSTPVVASEGTPDAPDAQTPESAAPAVETAETPTPRRRRKAATRVVTPCGDGSIEVGSVEPMNGYAVVAIDDQRFLNDGVVVAIGENFNPQRLQVGERILFAEFTAIDDRHIAVKYDEVIARIGASDPVNAYIEQSRVEDPPPPAPEDVPMDEGVQPDFDYPAPAAPSGSIQIELPTPAPAPVRGSAVVHKGGKPAPQFEGIKQLNKPIRR